MPGSLKEYMFERKEIPIAAYQPGNVRQSFPTEREARKEYSRLRSIAQKRLERLERATKNEEGYISREAGKVLESTGSFDKLKDIEGEQIYTQLERVAQFLHSRRSSMSTLREAVEAEYKAAYESQNIKDALAYFRSIKNDSRSDEAADSEFAFAGDDFDLDDDFFPGLFSEDETPETKEEQDALYDDLSELFDIFDQLRNWNLENLRYVQAAIKAVYEGRDKSEDELIRELTEMELARS